MVFCFFYIILGLKSTFLLLENKKTGSLFFNVQQASSCMFCLNLFIKCHASGLKKTEFSHCKFAKQFLLLWKDVFLFKQNNKDRRKICGFFYSVCLSCSICKTFEVALQWYILWNIFKPFKLRNMRALQHLHSLLLTVALLPVCFIPHS